MTFEPNSQDAARLRRHFETRLDRVLTLTRALCEIESPSGDGEGSAAAVALLVTAASDLGAGVSIERIAAPEGYGEHFILRAFDGPSDERPLLLLGHTDTVHPKGTLAARPW